MSVHQLRRRLWEGNCGGYVFQRNCSSLRETVEDMYSRGTALHRVHQLSRRLWEGNCGDVMKKIAYDNIRMYSRGTAGGYVFQRNCWGICIPEELLFIATTSLSRQPQNRGRRGIFYSWKIFREKNRLESSHPVMSTTSTPGDSSSKQV